MQSKTLILSVLISLLLVFLLGCGENEEAPVEVIEPPSEEPALEEPFLTVPEIAKIASDSTVSLRIKRADSGFFIQWYPVAVFSLVMVRSQLTTT